MGTATGVKIDEHVDRWRVLVHMRYGYKLLFAMGDNDGAEEMAHEHARFIIERGPYVKDDRGVRTYFPPSAVDKVKVLPPGVQVNETKGGLAP